MPPLIDLTGNRYGRLTVLRRAENRNGLTGRNHVYWLCICDCGCTVEVSRAHLKSGHTQSCGCIHSEMLSERNQVHSGSNTRLYNIWIGMKSRCLNFRNKRYGNYGGRGISICKEWLNSFESFRDWALANGYDENAEHGKCTLDRIDVNGNYCPENCRFISMSEQANNKTNSVFYEFDGERITQAEASRRTGIPASTMYRKRMKGISLDEMRK